MQGAGLNHTDAPYCNLMSPQHSPWKSIQKNNAKSWSMKMSKKMTSGHLLWHFLSAISMPVKLFLDIHQHAQNPKLRDFLSCSDDALKFWTSVFSIENRVEHVVLSGLIFDPRFQSVIFQKRLVNVSSDLFWNECSAVHLMPIGIHHKSVERVSAAILVII